VSRQFQILAGVRQGGVLSPCLFAVFIDSIVCKLRLAGDGASIGRHYLGCMLYADDSMLVCNSITAMQRMLEICSREAEMLDFSFNTAKSVASVAAAAGDDEGCLLTVSAHVPRCCPATPLAATTSIFSAALEIRGELSRQLV